MVVVASCPCPKPRHLTAYYLRKARSHDNISPSLFALEEERPQQRRGGVGIEQAATALPAEKVRASSGEAAGGGEHRPGFIRGVPRFGDRGLVCYGGRGVSEAFSMWPCGQAGHPAHYRHAGLRARWLGLTSTHGLRQLLWAHDCMEAHGGDVPGDEGFAPAPDPGGAGKDGRRGAPPRCGPNGGDGGRAGREEADQGCGVHDVYVEMQHKVITPASVKKTHFYHRSYSPQWRPDIKVLNYNGGGRHLIINVVVDFPCCASEVGRVSSVQLHTASAEERRKVTLYGDVFAHRLLVRFAVEAFGEVGVQAEQFLEECSGRRQDRLVALELELEEDLCLPLLLSLARPAKRAKNESGEGMG
eukprot:gene1374-biopygen1220